MQFLIWNNQKDAEDSLTAVNTAYGCPYVADNGYKMDRWDNLSPSRDGSQWGFYKPDTRLDMQAADLMSVLIPGFVENKDKPAEFYPEDDGEA